MPQVGHGGCAPSSCWARGVRLACCAATRLLGRPWPCAAPPRTAVPLDEEGPRVRQRRSPDGGGEGAEPGERDGEAADVADDRDGLARMGAGDLLDGCRH